MEKLEPVVLITGAARRIGAAIACNLHAAGWRVAIHCHRSRDQASELAARLNAERADSAAVLMADLRDPAQLEPLAQQAAAQWGRLDALVNNASGYRRTPVGQLDAGALQEMLDTNFTAPLLLIRACLPYFAQRASVVNILDTLARHARPGFVAYNAAKSALWSATETLAAELAPQVRVNGVAPGHILWAEHTRLTEAQQRDELAQVPLGRLGAPAEIAAAVRYLLSDDGAYCNGTVLQVDGGLRLR